MALFLISILIFFLISAGIWGAFIEARRIKTGEVYLEIKNLPLSFKGFKILHLSDFHSSKFGQKENKVLETLNKLKPDLILITGDVIGRRTKDLKSCQKFWKELARNYEGRIFGVYGNHDHRNKKFEELDNLFKESKIDFLNNESRKIEKDGESIYLIGVDDPHLGYDNIEKAIKGAENSNPKILLAHSPEIFRKVRGKGINLVLAGHTHGGQINLPIFSNLILPLKYDKKYKNGLFKENSIYLYVNRGVGEAFLPIRINAPPEITLIELQ